MLLHALLVALLSYTPYLPRPLCVGHLVHRSPLREQRVVHGRTLPVHMRTITEESISRIVELVQLDAALVKEQMQQRGADAAWELAKTSFERRWPLIKWTILYNADRTTLQAVEAAVNCSLVRQVLPAVYAELEWKRSHLTSSLAAQRSRLAAALIALRPAISQRLLEAARERPALIPSLSKRVVASTYAWWQWRSNIWLRRLRTPERFEATRAAIIEKWLQVHTFRPAPCPYPRTRPCACA
jgi:hypothetical protein